MDGNNSNCRADVLVIGLGAMGAATAYHLARKGLTVKCLDRFAPGHDHGSSHGQTRLIRKAYFEHPDYVPLVDRSERLWKELQAESGEVLYRQTGLFLAGRPDGPLVKGTRKAAQTHGLAIHELSKSDASGRFPGFRFDDDSVLLHEPGAGILHAEECVRAYVDRAAVHGADVVTGVRVRSWRSDDATVTVETDRGSYSAGALVVCAGAWSSVLLADLALPLEVRRKVVFWQAVNAGAYQINSGTPVFGYDVYGGFFYGFPSLDGQTVKVGEHTGGEAAESPDELDRTLRDGDHARVRSFVERYLPHATPQVVQHSVCMYTMTPDEHFIIDRHPAYQNVVFAAGFSGHGFKFAPVVGSVVADLLIDGSTSEPVGLFGVSRFLQSDGPAKLTPAHP